MWGTNVLLVLSLAAYVKPEQGNPLLAGPQPLYCPKPNGVYPIESSDCRKYMVCHEGKSTFMECPPELVFNPKNNWCDLPQNFNCKAIDVLAAATTPAPVHVSILPIVTYSVSAMTQSSDQALTYQEICPSPNGAFPMSSSDCRKYMICHEGKATVMDCPSGLMFNSNNNWCDLPQHVRCNSTVVMSPTSTPVPVQIPALTSTTILVPTLTQAPVRDQATFQQELCPEQDGSFPVPSRDCRKYMICHEGKPTFMDCPLGLVFNPNNNWCDLPKNVHCNSSVVVAPVSTPAPVFIPALTPTTTSVPTLTQAPVQVLTPVRDQATFQQELCPARDGSFPVPSQDCRKYMICYEGKPTFMDCPHGLVFNPNNNWCDLPKNVHCNFSVVVAPASTPAPVDVPTSIPTTTSVPTLTQATVQLLSPVQDQTTPQQELCPAQDGSFPIPSKDCRKYMICHEGKPTFMDCPLGLAFNPNNNWCDFPNNVHCNYSTVVASDSTPAPVRVPASTPTTTSVPTLTQAHIQVLTPVRDQATPHQELCPAYNGSFPVPSSDCRKYMICHEGKPTFMNCPLGLVFNPINHWCDLPQNVHCNFTIVATQTQMTSVPTPEYPVSTQTQAVPVQTSTPVQVLTSTHEGTCASPTGISPVSSIDCRENMDCGKGKTTSKDCPTELDYNPNQNNCNLTQNVHCNTKAVVAPFPVPRPAPIPATNRTSTHIQSRVQASSSVQIPVVSQQAICSKQDGTFPVSSNDCRKYMFCHEGKATILDCPPGLVFNPNNSWCDLPQNVRCNFSVVVAPVSTPAPVRVSPSSAIKPVSVYYKVPVQAPTLVQTPADIQQVVCPRRDGIFPVPNSDCRKYVICLKGQGTVMECPSGLVYNSNENICDLPQNVHCNSHAVVAPIPFPVPIPASNPASHSASVHVQASAQTSTPEQTFCSKQDGTFPVSSNDCRKYMFCREGKAIFMDCPSGLVFNSNNNWCDLPQNVRCNSSVLVAPISIPPPVRNPRTPATNQISAYTQAPVQAPTALRVPVTPEQLICPRRDGFFPVSSSDCRKYMICWAGEATAMECPSGLAYNPNENFCDLPQNVHCNSNVMVPPTPFPVPIPAPIPATHLASVHIQAHVQISTPVQEPAALQEAICYRQDGTFAVSSNDCRKYIFCHEGIGTFMDCPLGLVFNPKNNWCDLPQNVRCNSSNVVAPVSTPAPIRITSFSVTKPVSAQSQAPVQAPTLVQVPVAPQQAFCPRQDGMFPVSSSDCRKYVICRKGQATVMECPSGLAFNPNKNICDLPESAHCYTNITSSPVLRPARTPPSMSAPPRASLTAPVPALTSFSVLAPSPSPALAPTLGVLIDFSCQQSNGYYAVPDECDTYIVCQRNVAYKALCPDGLHFNPEAKYPDYACGYSPEVQCARGSVEQNPKATNQCPRQYGFFPMSDSECSKYLRCHEGIATVMDCPHGLVFNPNKNSCDWPENVPLCNPNAFKGYTCPDARLEADGSLSDIMVKYRYNNDCSYFVTCHKGSPRLLKCEAGKSFEEASQACIDSAYVTNCENRS